VISDLTNFWVKVQLTKHTHTHTHGNRQTDSDLIGNGANFVGITGRVNVIKHTHTITSFSSVLKTIKVYNAQKHPLTMTHTYTQQHTI